MFLSLVPPDRILSPITRSAATSLGAGAVAVVMITCGLVVAVLSRRQQGHDPEEGVDLELAAGDVLMIHDPDHFAIRCDLFHVVATLVLSGTLSAAAVRTEPPGDGPLSVKEVGSLLGQHKVPGASLAIIQNGEIVATYSRPSMRSRCSSWSKLASSASMIRSINDFSRGNFPTMRSPRRRRLRC
jgi:hypothetical protein